MIIFLYGQDNFRSLEKLKEIKNKFIREIDPNKLNIDILSEKHNLSECSKAIKSSPFLAKRRLIIFKNFLNNKNRDFLDELYKILEDYRLNLNQNNSNILIFYENSEKIGTSKLAKFLKEQKLCYKFPLLKGFALNKWIKQRVKQMNGLIHDDAIKELAALIGNDLWILDNEIKKLVNFKNQTRIQKQDVIKLVKGKFDDNIFNLIDAISIKNKNQALKLFLQQIENGTHPMYLLTMLIRQVRILLSTKKMLEDNKTKQQISIYLNLHPFVIKKAIEQSKNFTYDQLVNIYKKLLEIDFYLKNSQLKKQINILFELFILKL